MMLQQSIRLCGVVRYIENHEHCVRHVPREFRQNHNRGETPHYFELQNVAKCFVCFLQLFTDPIHNVSKFVQRCLFILYSRWGHLMVSAQPRHSFFALRRRLICIHSFKFSTQTSSRNSLALACYVPSLPLHSCFCNARIGLLRVDESLALCHPTFQPWSSQCSINHELLNFVGTCSISWQKSEINKKLNIAPSAPSWAQHRGSGIWAPDIYFCRKMITNKTGHGTNQI